MAHIQNITDENGDLKYYRVFVSYKDPGTVKYKKKWRLQLPGEYDDSKSFVFCRPDGKPYRPKHYNDKMKHYLKKQV